MRLICENCDHGYSAKLQTCYFCGTSSTFAFSLEQKSVVDVETYPDYFLIHFHTGEDFEITPYRNLNKADLRKALSRYTLVTFNGNYYDLHMIMAALDDYDNGALYQLSCALIAAERPERYRYVAWIDHIDMFDVLPGKGSLKAYGAKNHTRLVQDLPYDPNQCTDWGERYLIKEYCGNDTTVLTELVAKFEKQLALRESISEEYGIDVRSRSDPQIAEAVFRKVLNTKVDIPVYKEGTEFYYQPPAWMSFVNLDILERLAQCPFSINPKGGVSPAFDADFIDWGDKQVRLSIIGEYMTRPKNWKSTPVKIGDTTYTMGIGGLHSNEKSRCLRTNDRRVLRDHDVASYYPSLILATSIYPEQIGVRFLEIYDSWYHDRLRAKKTGDKGRADSLKTFLNGVFGKLNDKFSIFYAPKGLIQVTMTGQLALLMLIEKLELSGVPVVSANTDGLVLNCPKNLEFLADSIIKDWETVTGFETERTDYAILAARDVNSYIAIKPDGDVKLKGAYAPPEPGPSGWPNPTGQICVDAAVAFLTKGASIAKTVTACTDIRQFVYARAVKGGGCLNTRPVIPKKTTKKHRQELLDLFEVSDYEALRQWSLDSSEYLGKVVRWYYGDNPNAWIQYKQSGNMVPRSISAWPVMELPDSIPENLNYDWYVDETKSILKDIGVMI